MKFLEKDLEEIIYTGNRELLSEKGLNIDGTLLRQFRIGNYGISDLISYERPSYTPALGRTLKGCITVYELKQDKIGISTFLQALGYLKGIKRYLHKRGLENNYNYKIVLIGKTMDLNSTYAYLEDFFQIDFEGDVEDSPQFEIHNYTYDYDINGISFKEMFGYKLNEEGF